MARSSLEVARRAWSELALAADAFQDGHRQVIVEPNSRLAPAGWVGIVTLGPAAVITVPDQRTASIVMDTTASVPLGALMNFDWSAAGALAVLGPAALFFGGITDASSTVSVDALPSSDDAISDLVRRVSREDAEEASVQEATSPVFIVRSGTSVVAACGYRPWLATLAHMSVLVDPRHRGRGSGRIVAGAALAHAARAGLLPQWRARPIASQRLAASLGLEHLGSQSSALFDRT